MTEPVDSHPPLPRNMSLKAFDPHRQDFFCKYETDAVPPIDPEAEAWFQEGLRVTSHSQWPNQRNYPKAVELWQKAAERKHWKAMMNLAGVLAQGDGVEPYVVRRETERAVRIVEEAMKLGVPAAFDAMGTYHQWGIGVDGDISRAYAFWELAANMGSPSAQAFLGQALLGGYDNPKEGKWSNKPVGMKMLECSFSQGNGKAAFELALEYNAVNKDYKTAVFYYHEGVKFGSEECASALSVLFSGAELDRGGPSPDPARSERYGAFGDVLYYNPDLRFPNLDKVVPLPPAKLPQWDMSDPDTLIEAAKQVMPLAPPKPTPGSQRTGRAHIPQGHVLPGERPISAAERSAGHRSPPELAPPEPEGAVAPYSGYWLAQVVESVREFQIEWNRAQVPLRYEAGETFETPDRRSLGEYARLVGLRWHYMGVPAKLPEAPPYKRVARGIARTNRPPVLPRLGCCGSRPCPRTGIWIPWIDEGHPLRNVFNDRCQQSYVLEGQPFPDPRDLHLDIDPHALHWAWLDNANQPIPGGTRITLSDLHDAQGRPLT